MEDNLILLTLTLKQVNIRTFIIVVKYFNGENYEEFCKINNFYITCEPILTEYEHKHLIAYLRRKNML